MKRLAMSCTLVTALLAAPAAAQESGPSQPEPATDALAPRDPTVPAPTQYPDSSVSPGIQVEASDAQPLVGRLTPALEPAPEVTRWYGIQTLAVDAVSILLGFAALGAESEELALLGAAGYLLGGPIVHAAHGSFGRTAGSFALRVGLPFTAVGIGLLIEDCGDGGREWCGLGAMVIGLPVGILAAIILDAALLAKEKVRDPRGVQPTLAIRRDGLWLGTSGTF